MRSLLPCLLMYSTRVFLRVGYPKFSCISFTSLNEYSVLRLVITRDCRRWISSSSRKRPRCLLTLSVAICPN
ncbi:hypothetical protein RSOLAG1IB_11642 [Rhizoctonia solani AG-1 IB]|uniref:Uncharacterized protein n=1 Tax=Thanatephorus cucumeris (strain AG1-IB / isolate 7/3/14) TaxID=1108050 RepID=A0A0B7F8K2_THACB|nr:hypothetical protein RSOLAG1IB_11642 [Rhizoctonia solani AG-1 IB]